MALDLEAAIKQLTDLRIIAPETLADFIPPKAQPKSGDELVAELVKHSLLTKFQATQIVGGKGKVLVLGDYLLLDKIGAGGMGQVFRARHRHMERLVAIKLLPNAMTKDEAAVKLFHASRLESTRGVWQRPK
jgi:serine/threonine protein kinase